MARYARFGLDEILTGSHAHIRINQIVSVMSAYEIRILPPGKPIRLYAASLLGDHAAIRRAQTLAQAGDGIEVWRGLTCIYAAPI